MTVALPKLVVLAAGGTGGHMFPAQALARALIARGISVALITDRRGGGFGPDLPQVDTHCIDAGGIAGKRLFNKIMNVARLGLGTLQARSILKKLQGDVVVGFGGYPSVPTVVAGSRLGYRIILHEQNAVLGRANRLLASRAEAIAVSFAKVEGIADQYRTKLTVTGNPVRPAIAALGRRPYAVPGENDPLRLLVVGGSLGARVFNQIVPAAIGHLPAELRQRLTVIQQVPGPDLDEVDETYRACGVTHELAPFFTDVPKRLAAAHLVISRAGASTVAELAAAGRPGLMVPYPFATDDHQMANGQELAETGGGWILPQSTLTSEILAERLQSLLSAPASLARAAHCASRAAHTDAAERLADLVCNKAGSNGDHDLTKTEPGDGKEAAA